jgi:sodium/hydrogen antiporter
MKLDAWYLLIGALMLAVTFLDRFVKRLPITTTIIYLAVGVALGPVGLKALKLDPIDQSKFLETVAEIALLVSLFTAGLKLRAPLKADRWKLPLRLAFVSMTLTVVLIAIGGYYFLSLPIGAAILLGGILAPTDPVLASDVQLEHPGDRDRLRFSLTGEAGLNDGAAFPFVLLGLGLLGAHELGPLGVRWLAVDVLWAVAGGLGIGAVLGTITGRVVVRLTESQEESLSRNEFICLGLIAFSYGAALLLNTYGFLAVFAAGSALRHIEMRAAESNQRRDVQSDNADNPQSEMASNVLNANEQLERIMEIALVLMVGGMLSKDHFTWSAVAMAACIFLLIRPAAVLLGTYGANATSVQRALLGWFGIRGIGSLYYLMFAIQHGLPEQHAKQLTGLVLTIVTLSILVHGVSVTPIMSLYESRKRRA